MPCPVTGFRLRYIKLTSFFSMHECAHTRDRDTISNFDATKTAQFGHLRCPGPQDYGG